MRRNRGYCAARKEVIMASSPRTLRDRILADSSLFPARALLHVMGYRWHGKLFRGDKFPTPDGVSDYTKAGQKRLVEAVVGRALATVLAEAGISVDPATVFMILLCVKPNPGEEQEEVFDRGHDGYEIYRRGVPGWLRQTFGIDPELSVRCMSTGHTAVGLIEGYLAGEPDVGHTAEMVAYLANAISSPDGFYASFDQRHHDLIRTWVDAQPDMTLRESMRRDLTEFMRVAVLVAEWFVARSHFADIGKMFEAANHQLAAWYPEAL